jgi:hypothetical protein
MADIQITDPDTIRDIIYESSRLRFLLAETFKITPRRNKCDSTR